MARDKVAYADRVDLAATLDIAVALHRPAVREAIDRKSVV